MEVNLRELHGNWDKGFALHKQVLKSVCIGHYDNGRPKFDTERSEPGEALFRLKYRGDYNQAEPLAQAMRDHIVPALSDFAIVIPMPASTPRPRQPVHEIAKKLAVKLGLFYANGLLTKMPPPPGTPAIKDLATKTEKAAALAHSFVLNPAIITNDGKWGALLVDDLYDSGATLEAACAILRGYAKISQIFVATCSW
ncbi:putative amidophosphoribosyltransferase [Novosphingobium sp. 1748]|uniref:ComF family protein n=1 Tax=Novosphingobium sp. 1748 TaxID=2817760 RepID=UPI00285D4206|nr:ComF family protein [Novosphingobium sp. 1748]MDR6710159.1 putative amidophosphoribosyltransferase [Novosphingobium sp. 1748]